MTFYKIKQMKINYLLVIFISVFGKNEEKKKEKKMMIEESKKMNG